MSIAIELNGAKRDNINMTRVFVSYSHEQSAEAADLVEYLESRNFSCEWDKHVNPGASYLNEIDNMMINSDLGILILTEKSVGSEAVMREVGVLGGLRRQILLYVPEKTAAVDQSSLPGVLRKYDIYYEREQLAREAFKYSRFNDIFIHETRNITLETFRSHLNENADACKLKITINTPEGMDYSFLSQVKFSCLLITLSRLGYGSAYHERCPITDEPRQDKRCANDEDKVDICAVLAEPRCQKDENPETIILNSPMNCFSFTEHSDKNCFTVEYILPVHKEYGLTFKCFADTLNMTDGETLLKLLIAAGMRDVSFSDSINACRIYFLLPEYRFLLTVNMQNEAEYGEHTIKNNFICPLCLK